MSKRIPPVLARLAVLCLLCLASAPHAARAQSQATTGDIEGRVLDPNGAVIPGATVAARNQATGLERTATTDDDGIYRIVQLPPGSYTVKVNSQGFREWVGENAVVTVGGKTTVDVPLSVSGGEVVNINVFAEGQAVETTRTSVATTINERAIQNLPINGRNFQDFATLSPGVIRDPRGGDLSVVGSSRVDLQACKLEYSIVSPK